MKTINFKGKKYPTRTFVVTNDDIEHEQEITISTESLSDAMGDDKEVHDTEANDIDCTIYFYVDNDVINLSAEEICANHLDEPFGIIEEIN